MDVDDILGSHTECRGRSVKRREECILPDLPLSVRDLLSAHTTINTAILVKRIDIDQWLTKKEVDLDKSGLGELAHKIITRCRDDGRQRELFDTWIRDSASAWADRQYPALASIIEAAAVLNLPSIVTVIGKVLLDRDANPLVVSVAAQRVRHIQVPAAFQAEIAKALYLRIVGWEREYKTRSQLALISPSFAKFAFPNHREQVLNLLKTDSPVELVWGLVQGLTDLAAKTPDTLDDNTRSTLLEAVLGRLQREKASPTRAESGEYDLRSALVWCLGAVADKINSTVANELVLSFCQPVGLSDAAALGAARLLVRRHAMAATHAFLQAFEDPRSEICARFFSLLIKTSPNR